MTQENLARFKALLENGSITQEEYEQITGEKRTDQPESTIVDADQQDGISDLRCMKGCSIFLMCLSALTAVLSFVFIPPKPHFGEYDIGRAFLYIFGLGFWFLRGTVYNGIAFFSPDVRSGCSGRPAVKLPAMQRITALPKSV